MASGSNKAQQLQLKALNTSYSASTASNLSPRKDEAPNLGNTSFSNDMSGMYKGLKKFTIGKIYGNSTNSQGSAKEVSSPRQLESARS